MDIIKESDNLRVSLVHDESGEKPYDESATPILSREFRGYNSRFEAVNEAGEDFADTLNEILHRFDDPETVIERYLRIFHGAYSVLWDSSEYNRYVSFDTAAWRETHGLTDEYMDRVELDRSKLAEGSLSEMMSWANGEVYGYILERRVLTFTVYTDPVTGDEIRQSTGHEWHEVESCYGFFGYDYAKSEAEGEFDNYSE